MTTDEREIRRKLRVLEHAQDSGNIAKTCRYFGLPRSLFYLWLAAIENTVLMAWSGRSPFPNPTPIKHRLKSSKRFSTCERIIISDQRELCGIWHANINDRFTLFKVCHWGSSLLNSSLKLIRLFEIINWDCVARPLTRALVCVGAKLEWKLHTIAQWA